MKRLKCSILDELETVQGMFAAAQWWGTAAVQSGSYKSSPVGIMNVCIKSLGIQPERCWLSAGIRVWLWLQAVRSELPGYVSPLQPPQYLLWPLETFKDSQLWKDRRDQRNTKDDSSSQTSDRFITQLSWSTSEGGIWNLYLNTTQLWYGTTGNLRTCSSCCCTCECWAVVTAFKLSALSLFC